MIREHVLTYDERVVGILSYIPRTDCIIDIGAGIIPCPLFPCKRHVCIEPHFEYIEQLRKAHYEVLEGQAELLDSFPRENTTVVMADVIEHMDKPRGERMRDLAEQFDHAVVFTPLGVCERDGRNPDDWGLNGGFWQRHLSTWWPSDFPNWKVTSWDVWIGRMCGTILAVR